MTISPNSGRTITSDTLGFYVRDKVESAQVSMDRISEIATTLNIITYDAAYLELALRRQCKLATLDQALVAAARRAKHPVVTGTE